MSVVLVQGGNALYTVDTATGTSTALTLPSNVSLSTTLRPKFAMLNQWIAVVNSPSENLSIDPTGTVAPLVPRTPLQGPTAAASSGTGLTGNYLYKVTFIITNSNGDLLTESMMSPASAVVTPANQNIALTNIPTSQDTITARRLYRTVSGGSAYFQLADLDGNTATTYIDNLSDTSLSLLAASPTALQTPPGTLPGVKFKNIVSWKSRLWAVPSDPSLVDTIYFSETNKVYEWPNTLIAYPTGVDSQGVIAFAARKNYLGLLKRNGVWSIGGTSSTTGISATNVSVSQITNDVGGCIAADSVCVINDAAYWLGRDGVYKWDDNGIQNISNLQVAAWFKTDTYFNRAQFPNAVGFYNESRQTYQLHLSNVGSTNLDRWVTFYIPTQTWYGPSLTGAFTPSFGARTIDVNGLPIALVGGTDGNVYKANSTTYTDGSATAIDYDCFTPFMPADAPDIQHLFLNPSVVTRVDTQGTLTVTPYIGGTDAGAGTPLLVDLTKGRQRFTNLGTGRLIKFRLRQNDNAQGVGVFGIELPFAELGRR